MSEAPVSTGKVVRYQSGFYTIRLAKERPLTCGIRGKLKRRKIQGDIIAIGDEVNFTLLQDGSGVIEEILPRHSELVRLDPTPRGDYRQILLANPTRSSPFSPAQTLNLILECSIAFSSSLKNWN